MSSLALRMSHLMCSSIFRFREMQAQMLRLFEKIDVCCIEITRGIFVLEHTFKNLNFQKWVGTDLSMVLDLTLFNFLIL
jgi:hypothetical protein